MSKKDVIIFILGSLLTLSIILLFKKPKKDYEITLNKGIKAIEVKQDVKRKQVKSKTNEDIKNVISGNVDFDSLNRVWADFERKYGRR